MATIQSDTIKAEAQRLGFAACGLAPAEPVAPAHVTAFHQWLLDGRQADMRYLDRHEPLRRDPRQVMPEARTVVAVALSYYPAQRLRPDQWQFAYYAYGHDYHDLMRQRLDQLATSLRNLGLPVRTCCDTAPLPDRYWAWRAGLGWLGRNACLILPRLGSYFFLGELLVGAEADHYDSPLPGGCGDCRRCLTACPTGALSAGQPIDAARCLSYLTIEHRGPLPPHTARLMGTTIYGCDRCQMACPHNAHPQPTSEPDLQPSPEFLAMQPADWLALTPDRYRTLFRGSAVKRAKYEGLMRNIRAVAEARGLADNAQGKAAASPSPPISEGK